MQDWRFSHGDSSAGPDRMPSKRACSRRPQKWGRAKLYTDTLDDIADLGLGPEGSLALAVIRLAAADLTHQGHDTYRLRWSEWRESARIFFQSKHFRILCDGLGLSPDDIRRLRPDT